METLDQIVEAGPPIRQATGFQFTEGPLWHPDGYYYFVDLFANRLHRIVLGSAPELVRENTGGGNGATFDLNGRLVLCEGRNRRVTRMDADGRVEVIADRFEGGRFSRPNDVICGSDGSIYFSDPGLKLTLAERELTQSGVYRLRRDGNIALVADFEYPNGLAFSPDESVLYVANTRWGQYIHKLELDADGKVLRRSIFADMSSPDDQHGVPDGMKVDAAGRVYCSGPGGIWVFAPSGQKIGMIEVPEIAANFAFGGPDLKTMFITAHSSIYTIQLKVPGLPLHWYARRKLSD